ncbi:DNA primase [Candidatus Woesebacteria bacterium RIFCSPLOWO2_01_FULL_39_10]|uniref:DNA primase n=1 Tax=Candidatus Woesebacteria bacterium RIFCSPLOWO2_01_FULL_39_10 TaxID=1802516 RepID=A0A1F8B579_9BACT|nr:MAG: DNA primase [Candidatus Woesebacteria bacterium RIFCSPLOWO2_01_FULL_39_10]
MTDEVDEIKAKIDIVSIIGEHVELKKAGRNFKGLCPFHSEKTPSFVVSPEMQIFKCFGCGTSGDVYTFLQQYEGMDFYESLQFLAQKAGIKLKTRVGEKSDKEKEYSINQLAAKFYHWVLLNHPKGKDALNYIKTERGLTLETIQAFQIGYSPDAPFAFKKFLVEKKKIPVRDLERVGLVYTRDGRTFDRFRGRIIFPLFDHKGNIVGFAGRIIPGKAPVTLAKYINTPETDIYHKSKILFGLNLTKGEIKKEKCAIVVEGELDAISSWQVGIKNIVAVKGSSLTEEQVRLLARFTDTLILAMDADFAGDAAARRGIEMAEASGLEVRVARMHDFKDPDEAARKDPGALRNSFANAQGVWDFIIDSVVERYKGVSGQSKAKISRELVPVISAIQDKIVQAHYINIVAKRLEVPIEAVKEQIGKTFVGKGPKLITESFVKPKVKERYELLEERLLAVAFHYDPSVLLTRKVQKLFINPLVKRIITEFKTYSENHKTFDLKLFVSNLPKELVDAFIDIALKDTGFEEAAPERLQNELDLIIREIKMLSAKKNLNEIGSFIKKYEISGEKEKLKKAQQEFGELTKRLSELEEENFKGIILNK